MNRKRRKKREERQAHKNRCALFLLFCFAGFCVNASARNLHTEFLDLDMGYYYFYCEENIAAEIRVKDESIVNNDNLTLGNIAEISSNDAAIAERLRAISLGYSPNVGAIRELRKDKIFMAIASAGFSLNEVRLESLNVIRIRRASQTIESTTIRDSVEHVVLNPLKTVGAEAYLIRLDIPANVEVPMGEVEVRAGIGTVKDLFSPFSVSIEIRVDQRVVKRVSAMAQVEAKMPVVVAARDIQPNERIKETDVQIEMRKLIKPVTNYFRDFSKLRGTDSNRPIAKGEVITNDLVVSGIVVKTGDNVRVIYNSGKMQIVVTGEARALGRIGDRIQVKNIQSGNFLQAVIVDEGLVRVN